MQTHILTIGFYLSKSQARIRGQIRTQAWYTCLYYVRTYYTSYHMWMCLCILARALFTIHTFHKLYDAFEWTCKYYSKSRGRVRLRGYSTLLRVSIAESSITIIGSCSSCRAPASAPTHNVRGLRFAIVRMGCQWVIWIANWVLCAFARVENPCAWKCACTVRVCDGVGLFLGSVCWR